MKRIISTQEPPIVPQGYRLLEKGEFTRGGDLGWLTKDQKWQWCELWAGHVVNAEIIRKGSVCRKIE